MNLYQRTLFFMLNNVVPKCNNAYITCSNRADGMGAQAHAIYSAMVYAKVSKSRYLHSSLKRVDHNYEEDNSWEKKIEDYFSFIEEKNSSNEDNKVWDQAMIVNLNDLFSMLRFVFLFFLISKERAVIFKKEHYHEYPEIFPEEYGLIAKDIRHQFMSNKRSYKTFSGNKNLFIVCHVRRGDVSEQIPKRFTDNDTIEKRILRLVEFLKLHNISYSLHFVSQGKEKDFGALSKYGEFHLNGSPFIDFYNMVEADVLIMSKSSFSYTAALLSEGIIFYELFWHNPLPNWFDMDTEIFKSEKFQNLIFRKYQSIQDTPGS